MVSVVFRQEADGGSTTVEGAPGQSLMSAAKAQGVPGIEAICGGAMACGTCHVYVDDAWLAQLAAPSAAELEIVECGVEPRPGSRLACQIALKAELEGLVVTVPAAQI